MYANAVALVDSCGKPMLHIWHVKQGPLFIKSQILAPVFSTIEHMIDLFALNCVTVSYCLQLHKRSGIELQVESPSQCTHEEG